MRRYALSLSVFRPIVILSVILFSMLVYSCGSNQTAEVAPVTGTGSVAFSVKWEPAPASSTPAGAVEATVIPLAPVDICTVISTVDLYIWRKGTPDTIMPQRAIGCLCTDNSAKLSGIDAGIDNLYVRIVGLPGNWIGNSAYFKLTAGEDKDLGVITCTQPLITGVAAPTFSPASGTYTTAQTVTLETTTPEAPIRYTTDGSMPSDTVGTVYSIPISVSSSVTILAVAYLPGGASSVVSSATYTISGTVASPTFSPAPGTYATAQSVTLSTATSGATIRYTTDGSDPSATLGTVYSGTISVSSSVTIKAVAYKAGSTTSSVSSGPYTINPSQTIPLPPSSLAAPFSRIGSISLTWTDASSNESGFKIEKSTTGSTSGFQQIATVGANVTAYTDNGVTASTTYWYRVRAYNAAGDSVYSNVISVVIPPASTSGDWDTSIWDSTSWVWGP